jgi:TRAP-type C4-dicarboxylate transport system permease small subunit
VAENVSAESAHRSGVATALERALGILLIAVVAINIVNATGRYLLSYAFTGADEVMVFVMIYVVMGGAVLSLAQRKHININLLPSYARGRARHALYAIHDLVALGASLFAVYASWLFVARIARLGTTSMTLGIPMIIPHAAILLGFGAMAVVALFVFVRDIRALLADEPIVEEATAQAEAAG